MLKKLFILLLIGSLAFPIYSYADDKKSTPNSRLNIVSKTYPKSEILYRNDSKNDDTWEVFIIKDPDGSLYLISITKDNNMVPDYNIDLETLTIKNQGDTQTQTNIVQKELICVKNRSGILVNGILYFIGEESSYDRNVLDPIRCYK